MGAPSSRSRPAHLLPPDTVPLSVAVGTSYPPSLVFPEAGLRTCGPVATCPGKGAPSFVPIWSRERHTSCSVLPGRMCGWVWTCVRLYTDACECLCIYTCVMHIHGVWIFRYVRVCGCMCACIQPRVCGVRYTHRWPFPHSPPCEWTPWASTSGPVPPRLGQNLAIA